MHMREGGDGKEGAPRSQEKETTERSRSRRPGEYCGLVYIVIKKDISGQVSPVRSTRKESDKSLTVKSFKKQRAFLKDF